MTLGQVKWKYSVLVTHTFSHFSRNQYPYPQKHEQERELSRRKMSQRSKVISSFPDFSSIQHSVVIVKTLSGKSFSAKPLLD